MSEMVKIGSVWRHMKSGHDYIVFDLAVIERTMEDAVVYHRLNPIEDSRKWVRPLAEFTDGRFSLVAHMVAARGISEL